MKIALVALLFAAPAFADFEIGLYKGVDAQGRPCSINFKAKTFANNHPHPLNELVDVEAASADHVMPFTLKHPPQFNTETGEIAFTHEILQAVSATREGAVGVSVVMKHGNDKADGPQSFVFSIDNWKKPELSKVVQCQGLAFQAR